MSLRQRCPRRASTESRPRTLLEDEVYNIIPVHNLLADHPSLRFPEVRAAVAALGAVVDLRKPPFNQWLPDMDLLDWLGLFFGFQKDNVRNQREHLVLHLANAQMRLTPPPDNNDTLDGTVLRRFQKKLLKNYTDWCSYLGKKSYIWISHSREASDDRRRQLLYVSLYLLIWGEAANLRFVPQCLCYIFHHMALELNKILEDCTDENTGRPAMPSSTGENAFLNHVVKPIYEMMKAGTRNNYDGMNECFWSKRCFHQLKWPINVGSKFFVTSSDKAKHLRLKFQFFDTTMPFNVMPKEQLLNARGTVKNKLKDAIDRLKLRHGVGRPYMKLESNQVEATKLALIWNEIIMSFREEDIISDQELELLELPLNSWNVRVIQWPCFLLRNELLLALTKAKKLVDGSDRWLWKKICKNNEYRRCAVIEVYDCIKYLLLEIIKPNSEEHSIVKVLFQKIDHSLEIERFTETFKTTALPQLHSKLITLVELLNKPQKDSNKLVNTLQALYEIAIRDFFKIKRSDDQLREDGMAPQNLDSSGDLLFVNAIQLADTNNENFYRRVRRLDTILTCMDSMQNIPVNLEARRRIAFLSNSVFVNMPHAPQVEKMKAFSVLTPYYTEDVLVREEQLRAEKEDGISMLYYLQTRFDDEWKNFTERMRREGMMSDSDIRTHKLTDLRLWASYRGQTLSRTVRRMMYYYRALKMLAFLDTASEMDIQEGLTLKGLNSDERSPSSKSLSRASSSVSSLFKGHEYGTAVMKFTCVVACQMYGTQKKEKDPRADEILYLMKNNEALRVAYVDEVIIGRCEKEYYSVLVKYDQKLDKEVEIYRIKLPGPLKLGEEKSENQNHAIIFSRGDAVQTMDMNQDSYFEGALKMWNLL